MVHRSRVELARFLAFLGLLLLSAATLIAGIVAFLHYSSIPNVGFVFSGFGYDEVYGGKAIVGRVDADGPAAAAGLQVGDDVIRIDGVSPMEGTTFFRPGQQALELVVIRDGQRVSLAH